jgi:hypothetical protein
MPGAVLDLFLGPADGWDEGGGIGQIEAPKNQSRLVRLT